MKINIYFYILPLLLCASVITKAQDAHFSQYYNSPMTLNPALTGNGIEYIRVVALYRTQWAGMGTPFTTQGFAVDKVVNKVGIGAIITRSAASDGAIRNISIAGNLAYHIHLGSEKNHTLSAGAQVGVINRTIDESKLTFDSQYNPDLGYDPSLSSNEIYTATSITRPDVNVGLMWQRGWNNRDIRFRPFAGFSMFHITRPPISFIDSDDRMPVKKTFTAGAGYMLGDQLEIKPSFIHLNQNSFQQTTFGTMLSYDLDKRNTIQAGVYHRLNDAVIAYAGYKINRLFVGMSYDINTSALSRSGKGTNAYEISLSWSPVPKVKKESKAPVKKPAPATKKEVVNKSTVLNTPQTISNALPEMQLAIRVVHETPIEKVVQVQEVKKEEAQKPVTPVIAPSKITVAVAVSEVPLVKIADSDNDGIADAIDDCPYIRGTAVTKGCPDSDRDGIIDMLDDCPFDFGPSSNKGCPDPNIPAKAMTQELVKNYDNILFETGKTKVSIDDLFDIIERAIDVMYADKTTTVILSGHTDQEGDEAMNMELSEGRTEIVKSYLIRQGIDKSRIQTIAFGETMPASDNKTEEGRKRNRRVEINIVRIK